MQPPSTLPRGLRNNNPGNIRHGAAWQGLRSDQTDPSFAQFISPIYGIRALAKILLTYEASYKLNTVEEIITRWAPPTENDTESYIHSVCFYTGVRPDETLNLADNPTALLNLTRAIVIHENGAFAANALTAETISSGITLAIESTKLV